MSELISFSSIDDFSGVARSYSELLSREDNKDIGLIFPGTVRKYSGNPESVRENLVETANDCETGRRELFVVSDRGSVVGLSAIQRIDEPPVNLPSGTPNLSGFILNPFRGKGFGEESLRARLKIVDEHFDGYAYTEVRRENHVSRNMVEKVGLTAIASNEKFLWYVYDILER